VRLPEGSSVRVDESIRPETSTEKLARLRSVFSSDGPITAGNSSPLGDGAVAMLMGSAELAEKLGIDPLGEVLGSTVTAEEPDRFPLAAVNAVRKLMARLRARTEDVDLWEINEAFAAAVLAVLHHLPEINRERVNVNGGAIAYGHPLGASLPRIVVDLCRHLRARGGGLGVAVAGVGVGQGMAIAVRS
jgi:acetyl-CoA acetyltransferase family protein